MKSITMKLICCVSVLVLASTLGQSTLFGQEAGTVEVASSAATSASGAGASRPESASIAIAEPQLRIGPGDLIELKVFNVQELGQDIRVSDQGDANVNLIGSVHLAGLTTSDAQKLIARKLQEGNFVLNPYVSILIREYGTQGVSVLGEVKNPGVYQVLGTRTLLDVISLAGGTTQFADSHATIRRHSDGSLVAVAVTRDAKASLTSDVELQPGDRVIIPRAGVIYVLGDVDHPGGFLMHDDGRMTILQALALAGGSTRTASLSGTRLIRRTANGFTDTNLALNKILQGKVADSQLEADDILYIPNSAVKSAVYRTAPSIVSSAATAAIYLGM